jgi:hypothetical protein
MMGDPNGFNDQMIRLACVPKDLRVLPGLGISPVPPNPGQVALSNRLFVIFVSRPLGLRYCDFIDGSIKVHGSYSAEDTFISLCIIFSVQTSEDVENFISSKLAKEEMDFRQHLLDPGILNTLTSY